MSNQILLLFTGPVSQYRGGFDDEKLGLKNTVH